MLEILVALTKRKEAPLRLNGAWGLMVCNLRKSNDIVFSLYDRFSGYFNICC